MIAAEHAMLGRVTRFFNTAGPCRPDLHYMIDPLRRLEGVQELIDRQSYFVLHAPRQAGKTTALTALAERLTGEGHYAAALVSCESGRATSDDVGAAEEAILGAWRALLTVRLPAELQPPSWPTSAAGSRILSALSTWSRACPRPLVVFLDEIDSLSGNILLSILSQLRQGFALRPKDFPAALALVGMRDVRDYKVSVGALDNLGGASPFNIKEASLTLRNFTRDEVAELYAQHTGDTGQNFAADAVDLSFRLTNGQPWLVNALAREATDVLERDRSRPITRDVVEAARERVIARQDTHLDSLAERLREDRVRRVIEPIVAGTSAPQVPSDDLRYVLDLGLVQRSSEGGFEIANPIYREIIPRTLAEGARAFLPPIRPTWLTPDGRLDAQALLDAFLAFWQQHAEALFGAASYHEIAPHLVLMAFLHRVVNGGGRIEREYAVGSKRMDLLVEYGPTGRRDRLAMELKVWRPGEADPRGEGLAQLDGYLAGLGLDTGWLVIFDRRPGQPPLAERTRAETATSPSGRAITIVRA